MFAICCLFLVSVHSLQTTFAAVTKHPITDSAIKYPESIEVLVEDDVPESCKHLTYCTEKPKNYPEDRFNEMFKGYKAIPQPIMEEVEFTNRQGDPNEEDNCESEVTFKPLYQVKDAHEGVWRTVVQAPGHDFVQRVRLERCKNVGAKCFTNFSSNQDFLTFCKQKVNTWHVLVAKENNETEMIKTELPVCCSCHYKPIDFVTRFAKH